MPKNGKHGLSDATFDLALAFLTDSSHVQQDVRKTLTDAILQGDVKTLATCTKLVRVEDQAQSWLELRQVEALFKKNASYTDDEAATLAAADSFVLSEIQCSETNSRISDMLVKGIPTPLLATQISTMRKAIRHLLGDFSDFREGLAQRLRLTSGATADRSRVRSLPFLKVTRSIRLPRLAWTLCGDVLRELGFDESVNEVKYRHTERNCVTFVDKNFKTKRTIAKEGTHSVPFQLAFDSYAKEVLLRTWQVNLFDQSSGQEKARLGSIDGSYSTIDLERASDTVALMLVWLLFPREWAEFLFSLRSPGWFTEDLTAKAVLGSNGTYAKFSSMGNGSTFCIETIIFAAACIGVGAVDFSVYGDDIAVTRGHADHLLTLLHFLGFSPNKDKTCHQPVGSALVPFRESCGADWYEGHRVTPFYVRKTPSSYSDFHLCINGCVERALPLGAVWQLCRTWVQDEASHLVPMNLDSRSGVTIDPTSAHNLGLVKTSTYKTPWGRCSDSIPFFWGLEAASLEPRAARGLRSYLHWFLTGTPSTIPAWFPDQRRLGVRQGLRWLERPARASFDFLEQLMSRSDPRPPRITSLVNQAGDDFDLTTQSARVLYVPVRCPPHLYMWTHFLHGVTPGHSTIPLYWDASPG